MSNSPNKSKEYYNSKSIQLSHKNKLSPIIKKKKLNILKKPLYKENKEKDNKITSINFNQNSSCICIAVNKGFKIFSTQPFREHIERNMDSEITNIEMLYKSNLICFTCSDNPYNKYSANKVILWDDFQNKVILELRFDTKVLNIRIKKNCIFIVTVNAINIFNYALMQEEEPILTYKNLSGAFSISNDLDISIVAYPESAVGYIRIRDIESSNLTSLLVNAHDHMIQCLNISYKGDFVATSSVRGTIIRIFDSYTGLLLLELRRGSDNVVIYDIVFSFDCKIIACCSSKSTIHLFSLRTAYLKRNEAKLNKDGTKDSYNTIKCKEVDNIDNNYYSYNMGKIDDIHIVHKDTDINRQAKNQNYFKNELEDNETNTYNNNNKNEIVKSNNYLYNNKKDLDTPTNKNSFNSNNNRHYNEKYFEKIVIENELNYYKL